MIQTVFFKYLRSTVNADILLKKAAVKKTEEFKEIQKNSVVVNPSYHRKFAFILIFLEIKLILHMKQKTYSGHDY